MPYLEDIEDLKKSLDPESVLDILLPERKKTIKGNELRCACPVHEGENDNGFSLNLETHKWHCFSRGCKGTNLVDLYAQSKKTSFEEALKELLKAPLLPPQNTKEYKKPKTLKKQSGYTPEDVLNSWNNASKNGKDDYFSKKKLSPPPVAKFGKNPYGYHSTLIPLKDIYGVLKGVLSLNNGKKFNLKIADTLDASFTLLGEINPYERFYIGEGIATVQTAWEATARSIPAVSCGSCNNVMHCLREIMRKYPNAKPVFLIDCDEGENGEKVAKEIQKEFVEATFRKPSFEGMPNKKNEELKDFNDIISKCEQPLEEVKNQLNIEYKMQEIEIQEPPKKESAGSYYEKLGKIFGDPSLAKRFEGRDYEAFKKEHKEKFSGGGLITGFREIDDKLYFSNGDFVVIQAMSNHGKTTFMLQLAQKFLSVEENLKKNPMCLYLTYESSPIAVEAKFMNLLGHECGEKTVVKYDRSIEGRYLYPDRNSHFDTILRYNELSKNNNVLFLPRMGIESIGKLIDIQKAEYPERTIILFLDYIQIIDGEEKKEGWERIKAIAYKLEKLAISKEVIIITGSQVNENRQAREGRDIYNAATTVIDIFNHSHSSLKTNEKLKSEYRNPIEGKNVCSFNAIKQKHGESFALEERLLFNGFNFEENKKPKALFS